MCFGSVLNLPSETWDRDQVMDGRGKKKEKIIGGRGKLLIDDLALFFLLRSSERALEIPFTIHVFSRKP